MTKKEINMVQVNYIHENSVFLPYTVGTLAAYALNTPGIHEHYTFENIYFLRENTDILSDRISGSYLVGFSNYIWNCEYNKLLARKIKQKNPECIIVFGGHSINPDGTLLDECGFIDYLIHGEGEEIFTKLLLALANGIDVETVPNISFRKNGEHVSTALMQICGTDYVSPYLSGCFDKIMADNPLMDFQAIIEPSRGCPYCCTYCDWGNLNSQVKNFPLEKIYAELDWLSGKRIKFIAGADANFGMFKRDENIIDKMIELHKKTGYPSSFQTSYAKNSNERIFRMTKKLNECGMNKGVTISYQTLSTATLKNIKRNNISIDSFSELLKKYNHDEIATYTELIIGLPGETFESFVDGIDKVLDAGQHHYIYFHNCEWLPCAEMGRKEYIDKYKIKTSLVPLNQPHREQVENDEVQEFSRIVTEMYSMSSDDWVRMNLYATVLQCFHFGGFLQVYAIYLHREKSVKYSDFYLSLMNFVLTPENTVSYCVFSEIKGKIEAVISSSGGLTCEDSRFGNVLWSLDEYAFLLLAYNLKNFYLEIYDFLSGFGLEKDVFNSLYIYQQNIMKLPFDCDAAFSTDYDVKEYFENSLKGENAVLRKMRSSYKIESRTKYSSWSEYAKHIVWYGKKDRKNFFTNEVHVVHE